MISHIELAAEAKIKRSLSTNLQDAVDEDADSDVGAPEKRTADLVDIGGALDDDVDDFGEDVGADEVSIFPLQDHRLAIRIALQ